MFLIALASTGVLYYIWIYAPYVPYADQIVIRNRVVARHLEIPIFRKKEILFDLDTGEIKVDTIANRINLQVNRNMTQEQVSESVEQLKEAIEGVREMISIEPDDFEQQFRPQ